MNGALGLLGSRGNNTDIPAVRVPSGGSTTGSMSTVSKEDHNLVLSSDESCTYPDESDLELGLGLSLGGVKSQKPGAWGCQQYARILTAKDFPSSKSSSSSSSSSPNKTTVINNDNTSSPSCGSKRSAVESVSPPRSGLSQVVGWPPIRTYRMNSLGSQAKPPVTEELASNIDKVQGKNSVVDKPDGGSEKKNNEAKEKRFLKSSLFVKVSMDGVGIGRKVDLNAHGCYEALAQTLYDMFCRPSTCVRRSHVENRNENKEAAGPSTLLDGSSEFVLTYEDKEGDWMLVGDVPWEMFRSSVKRLRIMRTSEANGLAPRFQEKNGRQRT